MAEQEVRHTHKHMPPSKTTDDADAEPSIRKRQRDPANDTSMNREKKTKRQGTQRPAPLHQPLDAPVSDTESNTEGAIEKLLER